LHKPVKLGVDSANPLTETSIPAFAIAARTAPHRWSRSPRENTGTLHSPLQLSAMSHPHNVRGLEPAPSHSAMFQVSNRSPLWPVARFGFNPTTPFFAEDAAVGWYIQRNTALRVIRF